VKLDRRLQPVLKLPRQWSFDVYLFSDPVKALPASLLACWARKRSPDSPKGSVGSFCCAFGAFRILTTMDISRAEQRILHLLAQGGRIEIERTENKKIETVNCYTRDGWLYPGFGIELFRKLKQLMAIKSSGGHPYRITEQGLRLVRAQLDNR